MNLVHFLYCPFTGLGLRDGYRGDAWLKNRIRVFKRFVLPSLLNQTSKNFILWISWRPADLKNPIVQEFVYDLKFVQEFKIVNTFSGVCFWDDKYADGEARVRLENALLCSLPFLPDVFGKDTVLMTIQPSDDMYLPWMVEDVQSLARAMPKAHGAFGYAKGYIMNYSTKEIAEYNPTTPPPFYTIAFDANVFIDPQAHMKFTGPYKSHEYVKDFMPMSVSPERAFIVGTHGENISTTWSHPYKGRILEGEDRDAVLLSVGAWHTDPIVIKRPARLLARNVLNKLPFQGIIRNIYHRLPNKWQLF